MQSYEASTDLLHERVILVTGASAGIGRAAALACAAHGATVILLSRDLDKLNLVYDEIVAANYPTPAILTLDLGQAGIHEYQQLAEIIETTFGRLDGVLHNAGILGDITPLEMYDPDTWDTVMRINLRAPFMLTQALLPLLKLSPDASVLMTSSSVGRRARAFWGAYAISKCGIEGMVQMLSDELANISAVRVNAINPGATRTNMRANAYPGEDPMSIKTPEELMPMYLYLLGPDSQGITGQSFDAQVSKSA